MRTDLISMLALMRGPIMEALRGREQSDDERKIVELSSALLEGLAAAFDGGGTGPEELTQGGKYLELETLLERRKREQGMDGRPGLFDTFGTTANAIVRLTIGFLDNQPHGTTPSFERVALTAAWMSIGSLGETLRLLVVTGAGHNDPPYSEGIRLRAARDLTAMGMTGGWKVLFNGTDPYYVPSDPFAAGPSEYPPEPYVAINRGGKFFLPEELPAGAI